MEAGTAGEIKAVIKLTTGAVGHSRPEALLAGIRKQIELELGEDYWQIWHTDRVDVYYEPFKKGS